MMVVVRTRRSARWCATFGVLAALMAAAPGVAAADTRPADRTATSAAFLRTQDVVPSGRPTITYEVRFARVAKWERLPFRAIADRTLNDRRGWGERRGVEFTEVRRHGDFRLWLASAAVVRAAHPSCSAAYSCRVGRDVFINARRWREGADSYRTLPLLGYRQYVINHEVGHWLGLDHQGCTGRADPAPVMQQQTIGLDGCAPRIWPLPREHRAAATHPQLQAD